MRGVKWMEEVLRELRGGDKINISEILNCKRNLKVFLYFLFIISILIFYKKKEFESNFELFYNYVRF